MSTPIAFPINFAAVDSCPLTVGRFSTKDSTAAVIWFLLFSVLVFAVSAANPSKVLDIRPPTVYAATFTLSALPLLALVSVALTSILEASPVFPLLNVNFPPAYSTKRPDRRLLATRASPFPRTSSNNCCEPLTV